MWISVILPLMLLCVDLISIAPLLLVTLSRPLSIMAAASSECTLFIESSCLLQESPLNLVQKGNEIKF